MASRSLGTLTVDLVAKVNGFREGFDKAEREADKASKRLAKKAQQNQEAMAKWGAAFGVAAGTAAVGLAYFTKQAADAVDESADLAAQLNTTYASLKTLQLAGQNAGIGIDTTGTAVKKLNDTIGDLARGAKGAGVDALKALGLSADELAGMQADQKIGTIVGKIKEMVPAAQQAAVATDIFGKAAGAAMLQLDPERLEWAAKQAEIFGLNLSEIDAAKIGAINDTFDQLGMAIEGLGSQLALQLAPAINQIGVGFTQAANDAGGFAQVTETSINALMGTIAAVASTIDAVLVRPLQLAGNTIYQFFLGITRAVIAAVQKAVEFADNIPGVDLTDQVRSVAAFSDQLANMYASNEERIRKIFSEPLAGNDFAKWMADADAAARQIAAKAAGGANGIGASRAFGATPEKRIDAVDATGPMDAYLENLRAMKAEEDAIVEQAYAVQKRISEQEEQLRQDKLNGTRSMLGNLSTLMNSHSKKAFQIGKIAATAGAVMDGISAAIGSFKVGARIGGPALGAAFAAASVAATSGQIQAIRSQQFGGGSAGVSSTQAVNNASVPVQAGAGAGATGNVTYVQGLDPKQLFTGQQMVELINGAVKNGAVLRVR